jgi:hypothetical protein
MLASGRYQNRSRWLFAGRLESLAEQTAVHADDVPVEERDWFGEREAPRRVGDVRADPGEFREFDRVAGDSEWTTGSLRSDAARIDGRSTPNRSVSCRSRANTGDESSPSGGGRRRLVGGGCGEGDDTPTRVSPESPETPVGTRACSSRAIGGERRRVVEERSDIDVIWSERRRDVAGLRRGNDRES